MCQIDWDCAPDLHKNQDWDFNSSPILTFLEIGLTKNPRLSRLQSWFYRAGRDKSRLVGRVRESRNVKIILTLLDSQLSLLYPDLALTYLDFFLENSNLENRLISWRELMNGLKSRKSHLYPDSSILPVASRPFSIFISTPPTQPENCLGPSQSWNVPIVKI